MLNRRDDPILKLAARIQPELHRLYRRALADAMLGKPDAWRDYLLALEQLYMLAQLHGWRKIDYAVHMRYADDHDGVIKIKPFRKALAAIRKRVSVPVYVLQQMELRAKNWAFWITGVDRTKILDQVKKTISGAMAGKGIPSTSQIRAALGEEGKKIADARIETIVRTNVATGFMDGQRAAIGKNIKHFALLRLDEIHDRRTRGNPDGLYPNPLHPHYQMDGFMEEPTHPVWQTIWPPNGYNCRASITPITWLEAKSMGLVKNLKIDRAALDKHNGRRWYYITRGLYPDKGFQGPKQPVRPI